MMKNRGWILWVLLAAACGGKSQGDGSSISSAGQTGAGAGKASGGAASKGNAGAGNAGAGDAGTCLASIPAEGTACPTPGVSCPGYGSLSCPLTAVCGADSKWQIHCPSTMAFGPCSCPHED
jgi:hypothetical protein